VQPLVTIEIYSRVIDARLAQVRLEGAGIATFLLDESVASIDPFLINAIGGVKLQVKLDDEQEARELLRQPLPDEPNEIDESVPHCPRCDSEYIFEKGAGKSSMECRRCKHVAPKEEFLPSPKAGLWMRPKRAARGAPPVFCLERRRGLVGAIVGVTAGFLVAVVFPSVGLLLLLAGGSLGYMIGRALRYSVCSEPSCRAPLRAGERTCDKCGRRIRGTITSEEEHFVRVAEWKRQGDAN
jgi:hypothetical protein